MAKQARLSAQSWEQHRDRILRLYQDHPLDYVMRVMDEEHNFKASKNAFKKKLGRWSAPRKRKKHTAEPSTDEIRSQDCCSYEVISISSTSDRSSVESDSETDEPPRTYNPDGYTNSSASFSVGASALSRDSSKETPTNAYSLVDTASPMKLRCQTPRVLADQQRDITFCSGLFLSKLFQVDEIPSDQEMEFVLNSMFEEYAEMRNVAALQRLLAAYYSMFGPSHRSYLVQRKRYCGLAISIFGPRKASAVHFQKAIHTLTQSNVVLTCRLSLESDVRVALSLWQGGCLDDQALLSIVTKLEGLYEWRQAQICRAFGTKLAVLEGWASPPNRDSPVSIDGAATLAMSQWMISILNALLELLKRPTLEIEELRFVDKCMECLRSWQRNLNFTNLFTASFWESVRSLYDTFIRMDLISPLSKSKAYFAGICCISGMQWFNKCGQSDMVKIWYGRLNDRISRKSLENKIEYDDRVYELVHQVRSLNLHGVPIPSELFMDNEVAFPRS